MWLTPKQIEIKEKVVTEVQERVRVVTRIIERPDGTKETIIDEKRDTDTNIISEKESKPATSDWRVGVAASVPDVFTTGAAYTLNVERRILGDIYLGGYARTDKEFGVIISYSF